MDRKNLLAWYQFEDVENIGKDSSGRNMDAEVCGTSLLQGECMEGKSAALFPGGAYGSGYLKLPEGLLEGVSDDTGLTVSTWVYCDRISSPWERIFDFGAGTMGPYLFLTRFMRAVCFLNEDLAADAGGGVPEKKWVHVALTVSGTCKGTKSSAGPKLYINGELCKNGEISQTSSGTYKAYRNWLETFDKSENYAKNYIGHSQYEADPDFAGALSDFRIYRECLSQQDVLELMCLALDEEGVLQLAKEKYLKAPQKIITENPQLQRNLMAGKVAVSWCFEPEGIIDEDFQLHQTEKPVHLKIRATLQYKGKSLTEEYDATVLPKDTPAYELTVLGGKRVLDVSKTLYGLFYEDINHAADGGIYAEMVQNRSFENFTFENYDPSSGITGHSGDRHHDPMRYWFGDTEKVKFCLKDETSCSHYIEVKDHTVLYNRGFCDENMKCAMNLVAGDGYQFSLWTKSREPAAVKVTLLDENEKPVSDTVLVRWDGKNSWMKQTADRLVAGKTCLGQLRLEFLGDSAIDFVSLMPERVWGASEEAGSKTAHSNYEGNPNYRLRRDLVEALAELHPRFLRFPGGCISEGSFIWENVYDWKDSVGPVETRRENYNVWGYNMTLGLGYMEYFQLAEDLHATPLPVMACGVLCQARSDYAAPAGGELRERYIKNFTDLIDFAISTDFEGNRWARLRKEMGHEAPFDLHYLGVGNENWGTEFFANFEIFYERIDRHMKENYPGYDLQIISTAGAQADDVSYQLGWKFLTGNWRTKELVPFTDGEKTWEETVAFYQYKKDYLDTIVDEHYYRSNEYLLENADRYNYYYRDEESRTSKVFVGEYASSDKNTLAGAVAEAAVMTGFENNSDVVRLAATAPLFNKVATDGTYRWTPDVIWFDDTTLWRTPNYYVQQMFAKYIGDSLLATEFATYEKGRRMERLPKGGVSVRRHGDVEFKTLRILSSETGEELFRQDFGGVMSGELTTLSDGYYLDRQNWGNYRVELEAEVKENGAWISVGTGISTDRGAFDETAVSMHEYVVGHPEDGTGLRVLKNGIEGYKLGDYSCGVYAGNLRKCLDSTLEPGTYSVTVDFGCGEWNRICCAYAGKDGLKQGVLEGKLQCYNRELYQSVTEDEEKVYIKLVNADDFSKKCALHLKEMSLQKKGILVTLTAEEELVHLPNVNSREEELVTPQESILDVSNEMVVNILPNSVNVLVLTKNR